MGVKVTEREHGEEDLRARFVRREVWEDRVVCSSGRMVGNIFVMFAVGWLVGVRWCCCRKDVRL
jgi:hypothetical protein